MTSTVRSVRVVLDADVGAYVAKMKLAGAETDKAFNNIDRRLGTTTREFGAVEKSSSSATRSVAGTRDAIRGLDTDMGHASSSIRDARNELDSFSGRASIARDLVLTLGPALVPIGALGVPAIAGVAAQLGFAAAAGGTAVLALQGVGDGLKAIEAARLDPTVENLQKAHEALGKLGPDAINLVSHLDDLRSTGADLRDSAAQGFLPGLDDALTSLERKAPQAEGILRELGSVAGDLVARGAADLASSRWEPFFNYLRTDAKPILEDLGDTVGSLAHGFGSLFVATSGGQLDFSKWLRRQGESFDQWATRLRSSGDFQKFMAYVSSEGPKVAAAGAAIAKALAAVAEAAAPLGGPSLQALTAVADAVTAIADSPIGTPLLTLAAGLTAVSRAQRLLTGVGAIGGAGAGGGGILGGLVGSGTGSIKSQLDTIKSLPSAYREAAAAQESLAKAQTVYQTEASSYSAVLQSHNRSLAEGYEFVGKEGSASQAHLADSLGKVELANAGVTDATRTAAAAEARRSAVVRSSVGTLGKTAAVTAGLAVATSGLADSSGLSHTASLALLGTMAGPYGAALGAAAGVTLDLKDANDKAAAAQRDFNAVIAASPGDFLAQAAAIDGLRKKAADYRDDVHSDSVGEFFKNAFDPDAAVNATRKAFGLDTIDQQLDDTASKAQEASQKVQAAIAAIAKANGDRSLGNPSDYTSGRKGLIDTVTGPKVDATSLSEVQRVATQLQPTLAALGISFDDLGKQTPKQLAATAAAVSAYVSRADSAQGKNKALASAFADLDNTLLTTAQSASAVSSALDSLLSPNLNLSAATDGYTQSLRSLDHDLAKNNDTLKGNSDAALQNRDAVRTRVQALQAQLTAEANAGESSQQLVGSLRTQRQALISAGQAAGISKRDMSSYLDTLGLTPKLVKTLVTAQTGAAEGNVGSLTGDLNRLGKLHPTPHVTIDPGNSIQIISDINGRLLSLHNRTVYIRTVDLRSGPGGTGVSPQASAAGGPVRGPGGPPLALPFFQEAS